MNVRWIAGISRVFTLFCCLLASSAQAARLETYMVVRWEGRALEEPNLEALDALRKKFPEMAVIHLINPSYFKDNPLAAANLERIQRRVATQDEVGLYLALSSNLVKAANLIPIHQPTFWGYGDEVCTADCGLQVPATVYNRSDIAKLFWTAHTALTEAGFTKPTSFAVHGWLSPAGIAEVAEGFGYRNDLTGVEPALVEKQLKEYPIADWLRSVPGPSSSGNISAYTLAGGVIEFDTDEVVLKNFDTYFGKDHDRRHIFEVSVSEENLFMSRLRLEKSWEGIRNKATAAGDDLVFATFGSGKRASPVAKNVVITKKL